eukprot:TRINITY_DN6713_c0_g1_i2.p2 TRINITY_DN6713_c0_g1~~TRINITY_DN6713_c0_g1_i2.p2  ORF type:complete len:65 (-),score=1.36 TRINITY_DN6713_c0_g1_i2:166-360(-)
MSSDTSLALAGTTVLNRSLGEARDRIDREKTFARRKIRTELVVEWRSQPIHLLPDLKVHSSAFQ